MLRLMNLDFLVPDSYDLVTPDGKITLLSPLSPASSKAYVTIEHICPSFVGYQLESSQIRFNLKSTLAQLGLDATMVEFSLDPKRSRAEISIILTAKDPLAALLLPLLHEGAYIGKLFAADSRRLVRDPEYLSRMFGRVDRKGRPLLSLGGMEGSSNLILEKVDGRTVAYLACQEGVVRYDTSIEGFLPTLAKGLHTQEPMRRLLALHQNVTKDLPRNVHEGNILLVKTAPLHIRTVFASVVSDLLPPGYHHTSADVLQPDTQASGDIYELFGKSDKELLDIPLEFYTLEPYREHVFFGDRDQLQEALADPAAIFKAFKTAPGDLDLKASVFIVKGSQMHALTAEDWVATNPQRHDFPGLAHGTRQASMVERYISQQPSYPFLQHIETGRITSQGVLFERYFPSPLMKRMLLSDNVQRCLKGLYFLHPSRSSGPYFSVEDRALLGDLNKFAIPVFWVDESTGKILQYTQKSDDTSGMFVPLDQVAPFLSATVFGVYGSNLLNLSNTFSEFLTEILRGVLAMRHDAHHPLLGPSTPLALVTGGGPGAMEIGNYVAKTLGILSCGNIVDFRSKDGSIVNEQLQNPHVEAKMTYRLSQLVERQAQFNLDFPIFLTGGIGTDFEYSLEEVDRKVGNIPATPILLLGAPAYWRAKITSRFVCNMESGTIKGSEWLSNCMYCVQTPQEALQVYQRFFSGTLPIGKDGPIYPEGFVVVGEGAALP